MLKYWYISIFITNITPNQFNAINDHVFSVDCSDQVNNTDDTWGYECPVEITDQTTLESQSGNKLDIDNFRKGSVVKVTLVSTTDLINDSKPFRAEKVIKATESE
ncbi:hypothetical protein [Radiobacillus sp. PE A8.2]|uniref:hypothetical protein n=1 Tax=Radiobacillus sp. PE A8.2 TaxID=3380349 RepID=UPI00388D9F41